MQELAGEFDAKDAANLEEKGIALIGRPLYEAFIRDYTAKQWQTDPKDLPAEVISRLPVRYTYDNRYFNDTWEGLPVDGYTAWLERMADHPNIEVKLSTDYFDESQPPEQEGHGRTGPRCLHRAGGPVLRLRQGRAVVAHARLRAGGPPDRRLPGHQRHELRRRRRPVHAHHEFKHFHPERADRYPTDRTVVVRGVLSLRHARRRAVLPRQHRDDRAGLLAYRELAKGEQDVYFGGRLGTYQYLDMHMAIGRRLSMWNNSWREGRRIPRGDFHLRVPRRRVRGGGGTVDAFRRSVDVSTGGDDIDDAQRLRRRGSNSTGFRGSFTTGMEAGSAWAARLSPDSFAPFRGGQSTEPRRRTCSQGVRGRGIRADELLISPAPTTWRRIVDIGVASTNISSIVAEVDASR